MLETFQKIWKFAGDERDNINKSIVFCFINAVFGMFEIAAVYLAVRALTGEGSGEGIVWKTVLLIAAGIIGKAATKTFPSWSRPTRVILWREIRELQSEIS